MKENYSEFVTKLEPDYNKIIERVCVSGQMQLLHAMIGICTESGELQDAIKKQLIYGKELDDVNIKEELGDLLWYVQLACNVLGCTIDEVIEINVRKLTKRYGDRFTE